MTERKSRERGSDYPAPPSWRRSQPAPAPRCGGRALQVQNTTEWRRDFSSRRYQPGSACGGSSLIAGFHASS